ncbi:MAG TPA: PAS domain S-box protein [Terracidiphilus sp.]
MASIAAIIVSTTAFALHEAGIGETVLLITIVTFFMVAVVHARFLSLARDQNRQTTELLWNKDREFQSMFENALDAILVLDNKGVCQSANPSAGIFFSVCQDRIIGQAVRSFFSDTHDFDSMWGQLREDRRYRGEAELVRADGATVFAEFTAAAHFLPNHHLLVLRDITSRRRAQQAVNQSLLIARSSWQQAETLRKASIALTGDLRMNSVLDALLRTLVQFVPYERAQFFLLETDARLFLAYEAVNRPKLFHGTTFPETMSISDFPIVERVLARQEALLIDDLPDERNGTPFGKNSPVRSWVAVPIVSSNRVLGLLSITDSSPAQFSSSHLALTQSLATAAAVAIQNARLYERAEIYGAELERRIAELRQFEQTSQKSANVHRDSEERFQMIFRSTPVAIAVSSLADGRFIEINETFEQNFGFTLEDTELGLWEDPRERAELLGRLGRGGRVRGAVARFRQRSGLFRETMYSAESIDLNGEPCLLLGAEDQTGSGWNARN